MGVVGGIAINTAHELGHKRESLGALAEPRRPRPDRLRPLLHRAQPRPPRPRRHSRGPGQLAAGRELLGLPAAHRRRQPAAPPGGSRRARLDRLGKSHWSSHNDILSAWAMTVGLFAVLTIVFGPVVLPYLLLQAVLGFSLLEVVNYLEHYGLLRQKQRGRPLRALPARAQLEQQQRRLQRAALPPAAPQRPPRQPDPPLPGAAPRRRGAAAAHRLRRDDRPRLVPAALAPGDGPAPARRTSTATSPAPTSSRGQARADPRPLRQRSAPHEPLALPRLRLRLRRGGRAPARGLPGRDAVERGARRLGLPRLRRARQGRLRARRTRLE